MTLSLSALAIVGASVSSAAADEKVVQKFSGPGARQSCQNAANGYPSGVASCRVARSDHYTLFVDWDKQKKNDRKGQSNPHQRTERTQPSTGSAG